MARQFKKPDYEAIDKTSILLGEALPKGHLARFVVDVIKQLDLSSLYGRYAPTGGEAIAPEILLGILFYGYATGVFSSRKLEKGSYESIPMRYVSSGLHPDHDTIANFRKTFLPEIQELFVQILLLARTSGVLKVGNISLDGTKIHADASKSKAISYKRLGELEAKWRQEVQELMTLGEAADHGELVLPEGLVIVDEISLRQERLTNLAQAKGVLEARAQDRYALEKAEYEAKLKRRQEQAKHSKRKPRGRPPQPPQAGPQDKDQYNFTDPDSRIMKNSTDKGVDQHYNAQVAVTQDSLLIIAYSLSNHPNDKQELVPTLDAFDSSLGQVDAVASDNGYFSETNINACHDRNIDPYLAAGRETHHSSWQTFFAQEATPPPADASPKLKWPTGFRPKSGRPFIVYENVQLSR